LPIGNPTLVLKVGEQALDDRTHRGAARAVATLHVLRPPPNPTRAAIWSSKRRALLRRLARSTWSGEPTSMSRPLYNVVADVSRRKRAAYHGHRYFHEALPTAPIAQEAIDLILGLYRVEHDAKAQEIIGTKSHSGFDV
jgi:hypothetical protein